MGNLLFPNLFSLKKKKKLTSDKTLIYFIVVFLPGFLIKKCLASVTSQQMELNKSLEKVFQDSLEQENLKRKHVLADLYVQILCLLT